MPPELSVSPDEAEQPSRRWTLSRDLGLVAYALAISVVALLVPERIWSPMAYVLARVAVSLRWRQARSRRHRLEDWGVAPAGAARQILVRAAANDLISRFIGMRCALTRSWRPRVRLEGGENIEHVLGGGRGAVLWVAPTSWHTVATKVALYEAGFTVSHLSTTEHGFSRSRAGVRILNPVWVRGESRFVAERLVMADDDRGRALRTLIDRVRSGGIVSITAGSHGQRAHTVPMLAGSIRLAGGAASLALRTGAGLLPVWTVRASDGTFVTTVAPALEATNRSDRAGSEMAMTAAYAETLARVVADHPDEWQAWRE